LDGDFVEDVKVHLVPHLSVPVAVTLE